MRIAHKLALCMVVPLVLLALVGWRTTHLAERSLTDAVQRELVSWGQVVMHEVDRTIYHRLVEWREYGTRSTLDDALRDSNLRFAEIGDVEQLLAERDRAWREGRDDAIWLDQRSSAELQRLLEKLRELSGHSVYGEVFVTNRFGANVAASGRTTDYRQDDEEWWREAWRWGSHVSDVAYDESAGILSTELCLRIDDERGQPLGVLKAVLDLCEIRELVRNHLAPVGTRIVLFTDDGEILAAVDPGEEELDAAESLRGSCVLPEGATRSSSERVHIARRTDPATGAPLLSAFVQSAGFGDYPGLGWTVLVERDEREVLSSVQTLRSEFAAIVVWAALTVLLVCGLIALSMTRRIGRLSAAAHAIGRGDMEARCRLDGTDELADLGADFDQMAEQLREAARTLVLKNDALERLIADRERAEEELRQAQKLESIGRLAAGIAHEINTPTQFVGDNVRFLEEACADLLRAVERLSRLDGATEPTPEALAVLEEADVEYLSEEIPKALAQSTEGIRRITKIVLAMKDFSHPGEEEMTAIDLNHAIESTITVGRNEWKYVAEMEVDLDPDLPLVRCMPGEINQVVLNMIVNAAHAIADATAGDPERKGTIRISTRADGEEVEIRIADSGCGIPEEIRQKVFDPFFTTKEVGKGTGQGLALAHSVVTQRHGGALSLESAVGEGTTFVIRLPMNGPSSTPAEADTLAA